MRGKHSIHFFSLGYSGEGPCYARAFLYEARFTMSSDQIKSIGASARIELEDGEAVITYPERKTADRDPALRKSMRDKPRFQDELHAKAEDRATTKRLWQFWK